MTKKHFIALAETVRDMLAVGGINDDGIKLLSAFCGTQNPNFKQDRWINYIHGQCGPNGGQIK